MKKGFHVFLFVLFAVLMSQSAWALPGEGIGRQGAGATMYCSEPFFVSPTNGVTQFYLYDDGGPNGSYSNNCNTYIEVRVPEGYVIKLSGTIKAERYDYLVIKDGDASSTEYIAQRISGSGIDTTLDIGSYNSSGNKMTVYFITDGSVAGDGLRLRVDLVPLYKITLQQPEGSRSAIWVRMPSGENVREASWLAGDTVHLGYTTPYYLQGIRVTDANGNLVKVVYESENRLSFVMPASAVTVIPTMSSSGGTINMLNGERRSYISKSIKVYDDGDIDKPYTNNFDGWLTIWTELGYYLKVTGSVETEANSEYIYDYLEIYDGEKGASTTPICKVYSRSGSSTTTVDVPSNCKSSGEYLTIYFHSDVSNTASGLDLTVSRELRSYSVAVKTASNGRITSDVSSATKGSTITLTAVPNSGYVLKSVNVVNKVTGTTVATSGGWETNNKVTFTMPAGNVEVTPTFVTNTYSILRDPATSGGSISGASAATVGSTVTLTANPSKGYLFNSVSVTDANGKSLSVSGGKGFLDRSFSFTMPMGNVTVRPVWTDNVWTAADGLYTNMPATGIVNVTIPDGVNSFKVYDNGGNSGNYSNNSNGTLVLTAPTGSVLELSGTLTTNYTRSQTDKCLSGELWDGFYVCNQYAYTYSCDMDDNLSIYDGSSNAAASLLQGKIGCSSSDNSVSLGASVGIIRSSGNTMTLNFKSGYNGASSGLNLTVKIISDTYNVSIEASNNGSVSSDKNKAKIGSTVTLTAHPQSGYLLKNIQVKDASGNLVKLDKNNFTSWTFAMPPSDVTVTSTFTKELTVAGGLYIDIPNTGSVEVAIPEGVKSFKVYDDGSKDGNYSNNSNGTLVLTAPNGYVLELSGMLTTNYTSAQSDKCLSGELWDGFYVCNQYAYTYSCDMDDNLSVYDGSSNAAVSLLQGKIGCSSSDNSVSTGASIGKIMSSGPKMALNFKSGSSGNSSGLDLTVTLRKLEMELEDDGNGGKYVNMLVKNTAKLTIPKEVTSFKIYDDGGKDGLYSNNSNGTLVLTAPDGYVLELTGTVNTSSITSSQCTSVSGYDGSCEHFEYSYSCDTYDNLSVYDGTNNAATSLLEGLVGCESSGSSVSKGVSVGKIMSSGQKMALNFKSGSSGNSSGLDLTVTLRKLEMELEDDGNGGKYVNMLTNSIATLSIPNGIKSFKIYDDGGKNGNYSNNNKGSLVLRAPSGYVLELTGTITTNSTSAQSECISGELWDGFFVCSQYSYTYSCDMDDNLSVYDGSSNAAVSLLQGEVGCSSSGSSVSTGVSVGKIMSSGNTMTLNFMSGASGTSKGLDLTVKVVNFAITVNSATGGTVASSKGSAITNDVVTLTATPNNGYMFSGVTVKDASQNVVKSNNSSFTTAVFTMPASDVSVTPTFTNTFTAAGGLHLDFVRNKKNEVNIPSGVASFKIYDNGGKDSAYEANSNDTLTLAAPEGYRMKLTGSVIMENGYEYLYVYDGKNTKANSLLSTTGSANSNNMTSSKNISTVTSSGRYMTLHFRSDNSQNYAGLDLTVTLVPMNYTVTVATVTGGSMTSDKESAVVEGKVTLMATPDKGYLIDGVEVKDADNNVVALNNDIYWYCNTNTVSFKMPSASVTVTPKFSPINALSVNMPKKGSVMRCDVNIPENVTSFKIYDDGGANGNYSSNANGDLWVTFDEKSGYAGLKLSGTVSAKEGVYLSIMAATFYDFSDPFYIYKGSSDGHVEDIGTFINSSTLVFEFNTGKAGSAAGLDLRVDVVKSPGAGVDVVFDDAHVIGNGNINRWATITDGNKTSSLDITEDVEVDTVAFSRVFTPGNYSTIVFPFDVKANNLEGVAKVLRFNGFKQLEDKSWAVRMKRVWTPDTTKDINLNAYYPYLLVMNNEKLIVHEGVTFRKTIEPIAMADGSNWTFHGTLAYQAWPEGNSRIYGFQENKFVRAGEEGMDINPLRAYLLKPAPQQPSGRPSVDGTVYARTSIASVDDTPDEFYIVEDDDENGEHTTIIGRYNVRTGEFKMLRNYDLKGRKLNGKSNAHKAYYGKKVIRK